MPKLIPFPTRHVQRCAARLVIWSASRDPLSKPAPWSDRPMPPASLGNMLQQLAKQRPVLVLLFESVVAEILAQLQ